MNRAHCVRQVRPLCRQKDPKQIAASMHAAVNEAWAAQMKADKQAADMQAARDLALSALDAKEAELAKSTQLSNTLQNLCRELQSKHQSVRCPSCVWACVRPARLHTRGHPAGCVMLASCAA